MEEERPRGYTGDNQTSKGVCPMKIVVAIDSLKGSLSSLEAGQAIREGALRADARAEVAVRPLADGGEGTVEALVAGMNGTRCGVSVTGPLGEPVECTYGILPDGQTAVVEMSGAAGITLVDPARRDPLRATTYGVGEVLRDAIGRGCRRFLVGIGGSATNDGGVGMLQALGYEFLDASGRPIAPGAAGLAELCTIRADHVLPQLDQCSFKIACDVINPLCGPQGCSAVYGPQKGATPAMIEKMDGWLNRYAALAARLYPGKADPDHPGAGAAGGMGFAFLAFTHATLESGIDIVLEETDLAAYVRQADLVVTGEGRLDGQTAMGKAPVGVARLARQYGKPVIAFAGSVTPDAIACNGAGIDAFFPILRGVCTLEEAMDPDNARRNLADTAEQVFRLWKAAGKR